MGAHTYNCDPLLSGDVLCWRVEQGEGVLPDGILSVTGGWCPHVGILVKGWGRALCLEAVASGVTLTPVSNLVRRGDHLVVRRAPSPPAAPVVCYAQPLAHFAMDVWGYWEYSVSHLLAQTGRDLAGFFAGGERDYGDLDDPDRAPVAVICSELVSLALRRFLDYDPVPERADQWTWPTELAETPRLHTVCERLEIVKEG